MHEYNHFQPTCQGKWSEVPARGGSLGLLHLLPLYLRRGKHFKSIVLISCDRWLPVTVYQVISGCDPETYIAAPRVSDEQLTRPSLQNCQPCSSYTH